MTVAPAARLPSLQVGNLGTIGASCAHLSTPLRRREIEEPCEADTARSFYLQIESDLIQINRLAHAIQALTTVVGGVQDEVYYGLSVEIERHVDAINAAAGEPPLESGGQQ
jgi:hypothetical protein